MTVGVVDKEAVPDAETDLFKKTVRSVVRVPDPDREEVLSLCLVAELPGVLFPAATCAEKIINIDSCKKVFFMVFFYQLVNSRPVKIKNKVIQYY